MPYRIITTIFLGWLAYANVQNQAQTDPLVFPKDKYTVETKTIKTSAGDKTVKIHAYKHLLYVAKPVDKDYQSLDVSVPVEIDGLAVDAQNAPILFAIGVGGYISVNNAKGNVPGGPMFPGGGTPVDRRPGGPPRMQGGGKPQRTSNKDLALAAGFVLVMPGCRGRDNQAADGKYFGKAPAAIVDLKAAVRYLRHNKGRMPGNTDLIFSTGVSAGGALSALLGASGNNDLYAPYLKKIGAAATNDAIFGSACFCPITDLEHADGAYEWMYGSTPGRNGVVDQALSQKLIQQYKYYQEALHLKGQNGFGALTVDNYDDYILNNYLLPSANFFFKNLSDEARKDYLSKNPWISYSIEKGVAFKWTDYVAHVGRMKGLPAFDDFELKSPENIVFGNKTTNARHFTNFSQQQTTKTPAAEIDAEVKKQVDLMNAMFFIQASNKGCAQHWWIRHGTSDNHTSQSVIVNLGTALENQQKNVSTKLYWDAGHGADEDAEDFIAWIKHICATRK